MKNINEYDERQLRLMYKNLLSFENNQIELSSLVGCLEFLLNALESIDEKWEEEFLKEITILETVNALEIIKDSEEDFFEIKKDEENALVSNSINNLKKIIRIELMEF